MKSSLAVPFALLSRTLFAAALAVAVPAQALSLHEAAERALQNDPRLLAADEAVRASNANVDLAQSGFLPSLNASVEGGRSRLYTRAQFPQAGARNPLSWGLVASQPLYTGGLVSAQLEAAKSRLEGARQSESGTRQQLLLAATSVHLDVMRDRAVIGIHQATVGTLEQARDDTQKRFKAGEATRTDIAQATARLAEAQAGLQRALATAAVSAASYERIVGVAPEALGSEWPSPAVPATLAEALGSAGATPGVLAAQAQRRSAQAQIAAAKAGYLPRLSLEGEASDADDTQFTYDRLTYWSVQLKATLPIYEGGATRARIAEARANAAQADAQAADLRRQTVESITQSWALLKAAQDVIKAYEADVEASELALDSVRKELAVGTRTTLDLLDAERDLLSARVNLAASRHDRAVASLQLLAASGQLRLEAIP
ncbi:MAG: TolC family outer membrane protein [Nevskia sp.]